MNDHEKIIAFNKNIKGVGFPTNPALAFKKLLGIGGVDVSPETKKDILRWHNYCEQKPHLFHGIIFSNSFADALGEVAQSGGAFCIFSNGEIRIFVNIRDVVLKTDGEQ